MAIPADSSKNLPMSAFGCMGAMTEALAIAICDSREYLITVEEISQYGN